MTDNDNEYSQEVEIDSLPVESSAVRAIESAAFDIAVATAHRYPRRVSAALEYAKQLATMDLETAESMEYALPRDGKRITGYSIRCAEILATAWGNLAVAARVVEVGESRVLIQGVAHDLERNNRQSVEVAVPIRYSPKHPTKPSQRFSDDMINTAILRGIATARRNAIFTVIPRVYAKGVAEAAKAVVKAKGAGTHKARVDQAVDYCLKTWGVDEKRVWNALDVKSRADITPEKLDELRGMLVAVKDEGEAVDSVFPAKRQRKAATTATEKAPGPEAAAGDELDFDAMTGEVK